MRRPQPLSTAKFTKTITTPQCSQSRTARFCLSSTHITWSPSSTGNISMATKKRSKPVWSRSACNSRTLARKAAPTNHTQSPQSSLANMYTTTFTRFVTTILLLDSVEVNCRTNIEITDHPTRRTKRDHPTIRRPHHRPYSRSSPERGQAPRCLSTTCCQHG